MTLVWAQQIIPNPEIKLPKVEITNVANEPNTRGIVGGECSSEKSSLKEVKKLLFVFGGAGKGEDPLLELRQRLPADVLIAGEFRSNDKSAYKKIAEIAKTELLKLNSIDSPCKLYPEIAILGFSNGGNAALFNTKKLVEEENIKVTKLFLIDPVPWGACSLKPESKFFTPSCVGESQNFYQHLQKSSFWPPRFKWAKRGRTLDFGGTELKNFQFSKPQDLLNPFCRGEDPYKNAHSLILCDERVIQAALKILDNMSNLREDYQCVLKKNDPVKISNFKIKIPLLNGPCKIFA